MIKKILLGIAGLIASADPGNVRRYVPILSFYADSAI